MFSKPEEQIEEEEEEAEDEDDDRSGRSQTTRPRWLCSWQLEWRKEAQSCRLSQGWSSLLLFSFHEIDVCTQQVKIGVQEKKDKIGERVSKLQQLVSPFGKVGETST